MQSGTTSRKIHASRVTANLFAKPPSTTETGRDLNLVNEPPDSVQPPADNHLAALIQMDDPSSARRLQ